MKTTALAIALSTLLVGQAFAVSPDAPTAQPAQPQFRFQAYDGDPKRADPKQMAFQINRLDVRKPSEFLKLGETIPGTKFKLLKFQFKTRVNQSGEEEDASELTLLNITTNETLVLALPPIIYSLPKPQ